MTSATDASIYHPDPVGTGSARQDASPCALCGEDLPKNRAQAYFDDDNVDKRQLCVRCIISGAAHEQLGAEFTIDFHPDDGWGEVSAEVIAQIRERTPAPFTWQSARWLACCGDAAVYLGVLNQAAAQEAEQGADSARLDELVGAAGDDPPSWYLFRCRHCQKDLLFDDAP
jgi:uncharacterized protein CbrC (UPF0167 family)